MNKKNSIIAREKEVETHQNYLKKPNLKTFLTKPF